MIHKVIQLNIIFGRPQKKTVFVLTKALKKKKLYHALNNQKIDGIFDVWYKDTTTLKLSYIRYLIYLLYYNFAELEDYIFIYKSEFYYYI